MDEKRLFSIGEMAKAVGITRKIILNYEAKGLIKPDKKEANGGNRYYTIDTFTQIRTIRIFQNLGLSLDEIREYFNDTSDLQPVIKRLEEMRDRLTVTIKQLKERGDKEGNVVKEITIEPQKVYVRKFDAASVEDKTRLLRDTALGAIARHGTDISRRMYFTEYELSAPDVVSYCVAVPPESEGKNVVLIPQKEALSIFHYGSYESVPKTREKVIDYAKANGVELCGVFRNLYIEGPPQHKDPDKFITQIIAMKK